MRPVRQLIRQSVMVQSAAGPILKHNSPQASRFPAGEIQPGTGNRDPGKSKVPAIAFPLRSGSSGNRFPAHCREFETPGWAVMTQPIKAGMVGCCLSHWVVWFECAKGDAPWVFIGEDDLKLKGQGGHPQNFFTYMSWTVDMLAKKVPNWDILVLKRTGSDSAVGPPTEPEVAVYPDKPNSTLFEAKHLGGQFAYCMSKRACERIVASGLHSAMFCIDDFLSAITVGHFCRKIREHPAVVQVTTNGGMLKMYVDTQAENKFFTRERYATSDTDYPLDGIETHLDWRSAFGSDARGASAPKGKGKGAI